MSEYKPGIVKDGPDWPLPVCDTNGKLADEITRLRAENAKLKSTDMAVAMTEMSLRDEIVRLRARVAELERLARESLHVLTCNEEDDDDFGHRCSHCDDYVDRNGPHRDALRAALKEVKP